MRSRAPCRPELRRDIALAGRATNPRSGDFDPDLIRAAAKRRKISFLFPVCDFPPSAPKHAVQNQLNDVGLKELASSGSSFEEGSAHLFVFSFLKKQQELRTPPL
jgi:hypothetical protein